MAVFDVDRLAIQRLEATRNELRNKIQKEVWNRICQIFYNLFVIDTADDSLRSFFLCFPVMFMCTTVLDLQIPKRNGA